MRTLPKPYALLSLVVAMTLVSLTVNAFAIGQTHKQKHLRVAVTTTTYPVEKLSPTLLTAWIDSQPLVMPASLQRWDTTSYDPTATWPDVTDPVVKLPIEVQAKFACIRYHESRNHLHSVNVDSGASGWYQFLPYIWKYAAGQIHGLPASAAQATGDQQSTVAVWYYNHNHGFAPEWVGDGC